MQIIPTFTISSPQHVRVMQDVVGTYLSGIGGGKRLRARDSVSADAMKALFPPPPAASPSSVEEEITSVQKHTQSPRVAPTHTIVDMSVNAAPSAAPTPAPAPASGTTPGHTRARGVQARARYMSQDMETTLALQFAHTHTHGTTVSDRARRLSTFAGGINIAAELDSVNKIHMDDATRAMLAHTLAHTLGSARGQENGNRRSTARGNESGSGSGSEER